MATIALRAAALLCLLFAQLAAAQTAPIDVSESACAQIDCRCSGIAAPPWQRACLEHQTQLRQNCQASGGQITAFCRWQAAAASPSTLITIAAAKPGLSRESLQLDFDSKFWSMRQDVAHAEEFARRGQHKALGATAKRVESQSRQVIALAQALLQRLDRQSDEYRDLYNKVSSALSGQEQALGRWAGQGAAKLARRLERYRGNQAEGLANFHRGLGQHRQAAAAWRRAAIAAEALMAGSDKPRVWHYYRAQAASRLAQMARDQQRAGNRTQALATAGRADQLWQREYPQPQLAGAD